VLVDEVVRRNRRRIAVLTVVAVVNRAVLFGLILAAIAGKAAYDSELHLLVFVGGCLAVGGVLALWHVAKDLRSMDRGTLDGVGAVRILPGELPVVENLLQELAIAVGLPRVRAALAADDAPNALAVGRRPEATTIVVTSGLVRKLTRDELEAVLAAELWAIRRWDTATQTVTMAYAGEAIALHEGAVSGSHNPATWPWIVISFPTMVVAEIVRHRALRDADFGADAMAVATTRHPEALRRALVKLRDDPGVVETLDMTTAPLWFEPIPHGGDHDPDAYAAVAMTPTLDERLAHLDELLATP
jgi:heat shock protein HtpX